MNAISIPRITTGVETITPDMARLYLESSAGNRALKQAKIWSLKRDMIGGRFVPNGESIIFSDDGTLIDGHHRLSACRDSGVTIQSIVVWGVSYSAKKTVDTGASRTSGDHLSLDGIKNSNNLSAVINILLSLSAGRPRSANPSTSEIYDFISQYPDIHDAATFASTKAYSRLSNIFGAIYFVAMRNGDGLKAQAFKRVFATGVPEYDGCPAHLLRERLNSEAIKGKKTTVAETQKLAIAAWEKFRVKQPSRTLKTAASFKITGWQ
jgi:hypothetical protein